MPVATMPTTTHTDKPTRPPAFDAIKGSRCFQCNEYGHIAKQCPTKVCLMVQAYQQDLERTQGTINGKRTKDLIIDSGCQMTYKNSTNQTQKLVQVIHSAYCSCHVGDDLDLDYKRACELA